MNREELKNFRNNLETINENFVVVLKKLTENVSLIYDKKCDFDILYNGQTTIIFGIENIVCKDIFEAINKLLEMLKIN